MNVPNATVNAKSNARIANKTKPNGAIDMLDVGFHATSTESKFELKTKIQETKNWENKSYHYIVTTINEDLTLFLSPENATQLAKALLSQVQQIEEKEIQNHA